MAFADETVKLAWKRSGGKCECLRTAHKHVGLCDKRLSWDSRGSEGGSGAWEARYISSDPSGSADRPPAVKSSAGIVFAKRFDLLLAA